MTCLGVLLQLLWDSLSFLDFLEVYFLHQTEEVFLHYSNKLSISCCCSFPSGTPIIWILEHFMLSQRFLSLLTFLDSFFILFQLYILPFFPNHCFESWLPSCHCWFPEYFALFHFVYLSFVFHFSTKFSQFCEHFDYQGFKFAIR